ncbi:MAG TPA: sialate O-acetylesterase [Oscillospiraceae bacterium]|nr:sialate O-acetylesterase [Oscillospiraceae bacterium]HPF55592.1 sialate O-acetylesterase [Clostridiales bacterium]HPK35827.1 sialate O-acetylesterase [Oscillospiraceae bacterium]HPR76345.1 sialate O-acetylesterase [Oscillospiraceae bacterium]
MKQNQTVDLVIFMGQSNMSGRGNAAESVVCKSGHGYEFRAISDPDWLHDIVEPFGLDERNPESGVDDHAMSGSMVSALCEAYFSLTNIPIVAVSCSMGGTNTDFWHPDKPPIQDAKARLKAADLFLARNGFIVRHRFMVWCQGEQDGGAGLPGEEYITRFNAILDRMKMAGIEKCFVIQIGHRSDADDFDEIIAAQEKLCRENPDAVLVSTKLAELRDWMKDRSHFTQQAYNIAGTDAGLNMARFVLTGQKPL